MHEGPDRHVDGPLNSLLMGFPREEEADIDRVAPEGSAWIHEVMEGQGMLS